MILSLHSLTKKFGSFVAVEDISLDIVKGEVVGFVGANGAGKSTTIAMILGYLSPTRGTVTVSGRAVTVSNAHISHADIGYAAGDMGLFEGLTGDQYIEFVRRQGGGSVSRQNELVELFKPQLHKKISQLSRGNKQKIALIGAFVNQPKLIILDEPTSGLDPLMQQTFVELIQAEQARGATIFMSSHILSEVADVCTRIVVIADGRIIRDATAAEFEKTGHKQITITSRTKKVPDGAMDVTQKLVEKGVYRSSFIFGGSMDTLQTWLAGVKGITDITITDHSIEAAVYELYKEER